MKIAIIADIHDNIHNLNIFLDKIKNKDIDKIIVCGDACSIETMQVLSKNFKNEIIVIQGNADYYNNKDLKQLKNIKDLGRYGVANIQNKRVGICHEQTFIKNIINNKNKVDILFYGHSHKAWISDYQGVKIINPGTLGGVFQLASFAIWDIDKKSIKLELIDKL